MADDEVNATDSEDMEYFEAIEDIEQRLDDENPWMRDDNRYTAESVDEMTRADFDRRRELHLIYGTIHPDIPVEDDEWGARALKGSDSLAEYMDRAYSEQWRRGRDTWYPHMHIYADYHHRDTPVFDYTDDLDTRTAHQHRDSHLIDGFGTHDAMMGDDVNFADIQRWRNSIPDFIADAQTWSGDVERGYRLSNAYMDFHQRQLEDLERHGDRRVRTAQRVRDEKRLLATMQGAASRLGRYDGGYGVEADNPEPIPQQYYRTTGSKRQRGAGKRDSLNKHQPYRLIDPVTGLPTQNGGSLSDSAASVIKYMVMRYGLPALRAQLENLRDSHAQLHGTSDGGARREYMLMDAMAKQLGMGHSTPSTDHVGASAGQFLTAGSGQAAVPPGYHRMSDGRIMQNAQTGGAIQDVSLQEFNAARTTLVSILAGAAIADTPQGAPLATSLQQSAGEELNEVAANNTNNTLPVQPAAVPSTVDTSDSPVVTSQIIEDAARAAAQAAARDHGISAPPSTAKSAPPVIRDGAVLRTGAVQQVKPGRVSIAGGLGSAAIVPPVPPPAPPKRVDIDLATATVDTPTTRPKVGENYDRMMRHFQPSADTDTVTEVGLSQQTLYSLGVEALREYKAEEALKIDPAQDVAVFATILNASVGLTGMAMFTNYAFRLGYHFVEGGRQTHEQYSRKPGLEGKVFRFVLGSADKPTTIPGVAESLVRDTVIGALLIMIPFMAIVSQYNGTAATEVIQTVTSLMQAQGKEATDEFVDKVNAFTTLLSDTTVKEKASAAAQVSEVQAAAGVMGEVALASLLAYAGADYGQVAAWMSGNVVVQGAAQAGMRGMTGFAVGKAAQYTMEGRVPETDIAYTDAAALGLLRHGEYMGGTAGDQLNMEYSTNSNGEVMPAIRHTRATDGPGLFAGFVSGTEGVFSALAEIMGDNLRAYNGATYPDRTSPAAVATINHYNALPASERMVYSLSKYFEQPAAQIAARLLLKVCQHAPHLTPNEALIQTNMLLTQIRMGANDAIGDGEVDGVAIARNQVNELAELASVVGDFQFVINSGPTASARQAVHDARQAVHETRESVSDMAGTLSDMVFHESRMTELAMWILGKTAEAVFAAVDLLEPDDVLKAYRKQRMRELKANTVDE